MRSRAAARSASFCSRVSWNSSQFRKRHPASMASHKPDATSPEASRAVAPKIGSRCRGTFPSCSWSAAHAPAVTHSPQDRIGVASHFGCPPELVVDLEPGHAAPFPTGPRYPSTRCSVHSWRERASTTPTTSSSSRSIGCAPTASAGRSHSAHVPHASGPPHVHRCTIDDAVPAGPLVRAEVDLDPRIVMREDAHLVGQTPRALDSRWTSIWPAPTNLLRDSVDQSVTTL